MQETLNDLFLADKMLDMISVKGSDVLSLAAARNHLKRAFDTLEKLNAEMKGDGDNVLDGK